jgi:hypothetical protein
MGCDPFAEASVRDGVARAGEILEILPQPVARRGGHALQHGGEQRRHIGGLGASRGSELAGGSRRRRCLQAARAYAFSVVSSLIACATVLDFIAGYLLG